MQPRRPLRSLPAGDAPVNHFDRNLLGQILHEIYDHEHDLLTPERRKLLARAIAIVEGTELKQGGIVRLPAAIGPISDEMIPSIRAMIAEKVDQLIREREAELWVIAERLPDRPIPDRRWWRRRQETHAETTYRRWLRIFR